MTNYETDTGCKELFFFSDKFRLKGNLHLPNKQKPPVVIGSHGLFADRRSPKQLALAQACVSAGIAYFRFDHRGCGESQGDFSQKLSFKTRCRDLLKACDVIKERKDTGNLIALFGSSLGGAASLFAASLIKVQSVVTFAAPLNSGCVLEAIDKSGLSAKETSIPIKELLDFDFSQRLPEIKNILVIHGDLDEIVPISHAYDIFDRVSPPKKIRIQKQGDHRMSDKLHQETFARLCVRWFKQGFYI